MEDCLNSKIESMDKELFIKGKEMQLCISDSKPITLYIEKIEDNYNLHIRGDYPSGSTKIINLNKFYDGNFELLESEQKENTAFLIAINCIIEFVPHFIVSEAQEAAAIPPAVELNVSNLSKYIHILIELYCSKDHFGYLITPQELINIMNDFKVNRTTVFNLPVQTPSIMKVKIEECQEQFKLLENILPKSTIQKFTEDDKVIMIMLMRMLKDMYNMDVWDVCTLYIVYISEREVYSPIGINVTYHLIDCPEEIIGVFNI